MATGFGTIRNASGVGQAGQIPAAQNGGDKRSFIEIFDLADADFEGNNGDNNLCFDIPEGEAITAIKVQSTVSLGTSQLSFGTSAIPAALGAAKAYGTDAEAVVDYLDAAQKGVPMTERTRVYMTIGTANLPGTGKVVVEAETSSRG